MKAAALYLTHIIMGFSLVAGVSAHSLHDAESAIKAQERYAQFVDRPAPPFSLFDTDGEPVSLADLAGRVVVLNFLYTRCADACPLHMNLVAGLQEQVAERGLDDKVEFVTIATDNEDISGTYQNMGAYRRNFNLDPVNWHFLYRDESSAPDATRHLAEAYGLKFDPVGEGTQMHGIVTHILDQQGQMRARFHGMQFQPENLVTYVEVLVKGPSALNNSTWDDIHTYFEKLFN